MVVRFCQCVDALGCKHGYGPFWCAFQFTGSVRIAVAPAFGERPETDLWLHYRGGPSALAGLIHQEE